MRIFATPTSITPKTDANEKASPVDSVVSNPEDKKGIKPPIPIAIRIRKDLEKSICTFKDIR